MVICYTAIKNKYVFFLPPLKNIFLNDVLQFRYHMPTCVVFILFKTYCVSWIWFLFSINSEKVSAIVLYKIIRWIHSYSFLYELLLILSFWKLAFLHLSLISLYLLILFTFITLSFCDLFWVCALNLISSFLHLSVAVLMQYLQNPLIF